MKSIHQNSFWYPEFGLEIANKVLEIDLESKELEVTFEWVFK